MTLMVQGTATARRHLRLRMACLGWALQKVRSRMVWGIEQKEAHGGREGLSKRACIQV